MSENADMIATSITMAFGERCTDYSEGCPCCDAWKQYDDLRALQDERDGGWDSGYLAGFKASGEGWNGEFPFEGRAPELDEHWLATRDKSRPPHSKDSEG